MKSGSMSSYRAAMPPECFGEPDDGPEPVRRDRKGRPRVKSYQPDGVVVSWTGEIEVPEVAQVWDDASSSYVEVQYAASHPVLEGRYFCGPNAVAWEAAKRFARFMCSKGTPGVRIEDAD